MSRQFFSFAATALLFGFHSAVYAQVSLHARTLLKESVDESKVVTLPGNTHSEANGRNDRGAVAGDLPVDHMFLMLRRSPEQEQALERYLEELHDPNSANFHNWLTATQFGQQFGLAQEDLDTVTGWLQSHGFTVNVIYPNLVVDFSGTAAQVREAFHAEIHHLLVNGEQHYANITDPQIPRALASVIAGIASLQDFRPRPLSHPIPSYTINSGSQAIVPPDLYTIYDLKPAFAAGLSGQGQTIVVLEDSDLYSSGDWLVFRKVFGLARPYPNGRLATIHPNSASGNCLDPGVNGNDTEAIVDAEWATAAAPSATIEVASCADSFNFGGFIALQNLLSNGGTPPAIVSIGFGFSEANLGAANNAYISSLYQMAVAEGVSIFVSSGDSGAAFSDGSARSAINGIAVNGYASTPYNIAVGATDFADSYFGATTNYWSSTNSPTYSSALSYIPEIPWNDSCANGLLAASNGFSTTYGASGYCNNGGPLTIAASGGGPSGCATGSPFGTGGNACAGYPKPAWQHIVGNPGDGVRDIPDLSLFGSNGTWGHYYVVCFSDVSKGGASCLGAPNTWSGFGGTSFSAPIMAGIQSLVNQKTGSRWGNANTVYYSLASLEYGTNGNSSCNSDGSSLDSTCIFHDITVGDIDVDCAGSNNCFLGPQPGLYGALSTSGTAYQPAYAAMAGWDFATGIGSIDAWNLIANWPTAGNTGTASSVTDPDRR